MPELAEEVQVVDSFYRLVEYEQKQMAIKNQQIGVHDCVMLRDYLNEDAFCNNLKTRFLKDIIYTYIGQVLISVNPYKQLPIYSSAFMHDYQNVHLYERAPHIYAITDAAYRSLKNEQQDQCVLISGESGAGKTEASKKILDFVTNQSNGGHHAIRNKLLETNVLLEAFGNARTNRNDNSSRFGKYIDIMFDVYAQPVAGKIYHYLLEKSRVVAHGTKESNFHIFYLITDYLGEAFANFNYLNKESSPAGGLTFSQIQRALTALQLDESQQKYLLEILLAILHIGNVTFTHTDSQSSNPSDLKKIAQLLQCDQNDLSFSLTHRTIHAHTDKVQTFLNAENCSYARDALAKVLYDRLFTWLVKQINSSLASGQSFNRMSNPYTISFGIVDIYGFEVFQTNSFEQFCINYCNEKLQQLFIELTLRSEQVEYEREGIDWQHIKYFDNNVICQLIEQKHIGIISLLDEECVRPGNPSDKTFLQKINQSYKQHPHFVGANPHLNEFCLRHYAGDVTYNVNGFIDKNNDHLHTDLRLLLSHSKNHILRDIFDEPNDSKRRPDTIACQFKTSLNKLVSTLKLKQPSYVRCIKPNDGKLPMRFDDDIVHHQIKYLGLMENLRVRRAGFAYRRTYEAFVGRYKCLAPATWPKVRDEPQRAVQHILKRLQLRSDQYQMGKTKLFIRAAETVSQIEDAYQTRKNELVTQIIAVWKGYKQRRLFLDARKRVIILQAHVRALIARKEYTRRKWAAGVIRKFIKGFITRFDEQNDENKKFVLLAKVSWLRRLSMNLPSSVLNKYWPPCPSSCQTASDLLQNMHMKYLARQYVRHLSPTMRNQLHLKALAETIFKDKKSSYKSSIAAPFRDDRIPYELGQLKYKFISQVILNEVVMYACAVTKYDSHGYKPRARALFITNQNLYLADLKTFKLKQMMRLVDLQFIVTDQSDSLCLIRMMDVDVILELPNLIETITMVCNCAMSTNLVQIVNILSTQSIEHRVENGKRATILVENSSQNLIRKNNKGQLVVQVSN